MAVEQDHLSMFTSRTIRPRALAATVLIREAAAQGIGDEWEKRWALDRVTMDRFTFDQALEQLRGELAHAESTGDLSYAYSNAQFRLRLSQEALAAAQAQQPQ